MIIEFLEEQDVSIIANQEQAIFSDAWSEKSLYESLQQEHVKIFVAKDEKEQIAGYLILYVSFDEGDIARVAVDSSYRRKGIADQILERVWKYCGEQQITRILLEVRVSNHAAIRLYEKHGFQSIGVRKNYYTQPLEDGMIMEKGLDISTSI